MSQRLRAPTEDGVLAVPPLEQAGALLGDNGVSLAASQLSLLGVPLPALRTEARRQALAMADHYHWEQGEPLPERADLTRPLVVSGHQPELFHPGVWAKNFSLAALARQVNGLALNLIVDSDTLKSTALRVPRSDGHLASIPFDHWTGETPWEDRRVLAPATFAAFAPAVLATLEPFGYRPLLADVQAHLSRDVLTDGRPLGEAFVRARRAIERSWGVMNREVPLSRLWSTKAFARLAGHLLADLPRFHEVHNAAVQAHRVAHGIRSRNHPVPDLEIRDGFHEAPFWVYTREGRRQRLFARDDGSTLQLQPGPALPHPSTGEPFLRAWCSQSSAGLRLRSRALLTTLSARLLLADLFVHGLGGGLYDALTDTLFRNYLGLEPPAFLVLTATCRLPIVGKAPDLAKQERLVRDLTWNPQRYLNDEASVGLQAERAMWVEHVPETKAGRRERFQHLQRLTATLRAELSERRRTEESELARRENEKQRARALGRRDFSLVLYPEATLREFYQDWLESPASG